MNLLQVDKISKTYGEKTALDAVSFSVDQGEIVALLGSNGSGKTTSIKSICSLLEIDSGEIRVNGENINQSQKYLIDVGAVLEGARNIHWRLTALQNAEYFSTLKGGNWKKARKVADQFIGLLGLENQLSLEVGKMSTGNRQKVAILCALLHEPHIILLDEPTIGLDVGTVNQLKEFIREQSQLRNQGFLITSHDLQFVDEICDRVVVLSEGKKVFDGELSKLKQLVHQFELTLEAAHELTDEQQAALEGVISEDNIGIEKTNANLKLRFNNAQTSVDVIAQAKAMNVEVEQLEVKRISMEQAYQELVSARDND